MSVYVREREWVCVCVCVCVSRRERRHVFLGGFFFSVCLLSPCGCPNALCRNSVSPLRARPAPIRSEPFSLSVSFSHSLSFSPS